MGKGNGALNMHLFHMQAVLQGVYKIVSTPRNLYLGI